MIKMCVSGCSDEKMLICLGCVCSEMLQVSDHAPEKERHGFGGSIFLQVRLGHMFIHHDGKFLI